MELFWVVTVLFYFYFYFYFIFKFTKPVTIISYSLCALNSPTQQVT